MSIRGQAMRILLVEDDEVDAMAFTRAVSLTATEDSVAVVGDGEEAIEWLTEEGAAQSPDLVFLDLNLPRMNGFELRFFHVSNGMVC